MRGSQPFSSHLATRAPRWCWRDTYWRWSALPKDCKSESLPLLNVSLPWTPAYLITTLKSRPTPEVSWTKVSGDLPGSRTSFLHFNKTLQIVNVSESDAGDYRCSAKNQHGAAHHIISVVVKGVSTPSLFIPAFPFSPCPHSFHNWFMHRCHKDGLFSN